MLWMIRTFHKMSLFSTEPFFSEIYFGNRYILLRFLFSKFRK